MITLLMCFGPLLWIYRKHELRDTTEDDIFSVKVEMKVAAILNLCDKLRSIIGEEKRNIICDKQMTCFRIERYGRWANQIWSLRRALVVAKMVGIREIRVSPDHGLFINTVTYNGVTIIPELITQDEHCFFWNFFGRIPGVPYLNLTFDDEFKHVLASQLGEAVRNISNDILTVHVRSGDIFERPMTYAIEYGQPPCAFYEDAIAQRNWSEVWLFTEDNMNPCVDRVKALGAIEPGISWKGIVGTMMGTKNMIFGKGTLGPALAAVAFDLHRLYTAMIPTGQMKAKEHFNCVLSDNYVTKVSLRWRRSEEQMEMLRQEKCVAWEKIPYDPGPRNIYIHENNI